ncbi:MAG: DUF86 domain-containing protein [Clostridia bacterium]|nr:DUF86 domain-containing protein [Clostridia bacterium]
MKDKEKTIIEKIAKHTSKILQYTHGISYDDFIINSMLVEACVFNLSQIGELANKLDRDFQNQNPSVPWQLLYGLRNRIVHDYEGVNLVLIWDIVSADLPELNTQLLKLL